MTDVSEPPSLPATVGVQGLVKKLEKRCRDANVYRLDFDSLSKNLHLDIQRPEHVKWDILVVSPEQSPLLLAVVEKSGKEEKESGPQISSAKPKESDYKEALAYVRRLAQNLHEVLQISCPYPMCVLSLVVSVEKEDLDARIDEAISWAFVVLPYSCLVMTSPKYASILNAVKEKIDKWVFLEDSDKKRQRIMRTCTLFLEDDRKSKGGKATSVEANPKEKAFPDTCQLPQRKLKMGSASPTQDSRSGTFPKLCNDCRCLDLHQFDRNTIPLQLCVDEKSPTMKIDQQIFDQSEFLDDLLARVCAARNTPIIIDSSEKERLLWVLLIHIRNASPAGSYASAFEERMLDRFKPMSMGPIILENFHIKMISDEAEALWFLSVSIAPAFDGLVAKDFRSPQGLTHDLLEADLDCLVHLLFRRTDVPYHMPTRPQELEDKSDRDEVPVQECESIHFGSRKKKDNSDDDVHTYVDWLWKETCKPLRKYMSAFAKTHTGGTFYYGVEELKGKNKIHALDLNREWRLQIRQVLQKKIKEDMLWVQRDPKNDRGYTVLEPCDIKKGQHFDVAFIQVKDPEGKKDNLCILEVKVASFNGVVFNDRGPEVYVFEKKEEGGRKVYHPVPLAARDWLEKLQQYAWCWRSCSSTPGAPDTGDHDSLASASTTGAANAGRCGHSQTTVRSWRTGAASPHAGRPRMK